ncbi:glycosyltransferase [Candidatus Avelusimicrobium caledoniensis]|uniref:glycosyltransferase n=1 Tax=Candidatus Avelusimicrobium caledoniensis TaxID=3416220 RepID=UPI003D102081
MTTVSVLVLTYNHVRYIAQALDGFVSQRTKFPFEVLVYDDASTDGTADIIRRYAKQYPQLIKPVLQTNNQFSKGVYVDKAFNWPRVQGKYVALCEGDDYWSDPDKLQKQVDFLDAHPDYAVCFHPVKVIWEDKSHPESLFPSGAFRFNKTTLEVSDLLKHNFIQTNSVMYRWRFTDGDFAAMPDNILPCDWFLHLLHAQRGKIGFLPDVMAVYRRHGGSLWENSGQTFAWFNRCFLSNLRFFRAVKQTFSYEFTNEILSLFTQLLKLSAQQQDWTLFNRAIQEFPDLWQGCLNAAKQQRIFPWQDYLLYKLSWGTKRKTHKETYCARRHAFKLARLLRKLP